MFFTNRKGFTLLEILIAVFLSGIIILGLFELFNTVLNSEAFSKNKQERVELVYKIVSLINRDIRCKVGKFYVKTMDGRKVLDFQTTDSLLFGGSLAVSVSYYIKEYDGKPYLVREEKNGDAGEDLIIPLTDLFKKIDFRFYYGGEWRDAPSPIVKVILYSKTGKISFVCRGMI